MPKCKTCKKDFDRTRTYPVQVYCSDHCGNLYRVRRHRKAKTKGEK